MRIEQLLRERGREGRQGEEETLIGREKHEVESMQLGGGGMVWEGREGGRGVYDNSAQCKERRGERDQLQGVSHSELDNVTSLSCTLRIK